MNNTAHMECLLETSRETSRHFFLLKQDIFSKTSVFIFFIFFYFLTVGYFSMKANFYKLDWDGQMLKILK
jgi:hypothetical protein